MAPTVECDDRKVYALNAARAADLLIRDARILDPHTMTDLPCADVLITDGHIAAMGQDLPNPGRPAGNLEEVDARGKWLLPAFIDMHVHLREPGHEYKETIESGTQAAVAGGYGAVACMPNTKPVIDSEAIARFIINRARERGSCRVYPVGAISKGLAGEELAEFGELRESGVPAVSDDGRPVMNGLLMRRAMDYARIFDLLIISHCEDLNLAAGGLMNEGPTSTLLGLRGIPDAAEEVMVARDVLLAEVTGSRVHIAHASTAGSVRIIREAKSRGIRVSAETAPHYFTLTDKTIMGFDTVFKVNPPLRTERDIEAIKAGLADGTLDAIATDHAPHGDVEKDTEFDLAANGMIGLETALPLVLELVREGVLSPMAAVEKLTSGPAGLLGIPREGLTVGALADLTLIDPDVECIIDSKTFFSKSRNCPFDGRRVRGKALMTLVDGKIVYRNV